MQPHQKSKLDQQSQPNKTTHIPSPDHLSQNPINISKPSLRIKHSSPLDISSNLEFTNKSSKYIFSNSLANINPDGHSFSIRKIPHNTSNPHLSTYKSPIKAPIGPSEKEPQERINQIVKDISESDNELPLYRIWPGKNMFYFDGRLMTGPKADRVRTIIVCGGFLAIIAVFFAVVVPYLIDELDSMLPIVSSYLSLSTVMFFGLTSFTDPGIIPRKCVWELNGEVPQEYNERLKRNNGSVISQGKHAGQEENPSRFCEICKIYRPSRTVHCKCCGNCVEVHKGHLSFMSNCIGRRNYKFFMGFIASVILMSVCYITCFVLLIVQALRDHLQTNGWGFGDKTIDAVFGIIVGLPTIIFFFINLGFLIAYLRTRSEKKREIEGKNLQEIKPSVDWYSSEPSRINPRQLISRVQLLRYKAALTAEEPIEVIIEENEEE